MKIVMLATGNDKLNEIIKKIPNIEAIDSGIESRDELREACEYNMPDILIVTPQLAGRRNLPGELIEIKMAMPQLRIIYILGNIDLNNEQQVNPLGSMVNAGIYDIIHNTKLGAPLLTSIIENPRSKDQVEYLLKFLVLRESEEELDIEFSVEDEEIEDTEKGLKNVFVMSSIKPGTGKSFISVNVACAIARYGKKKSNGRPPRVALIEGDLQNLSVGTLLGIEENDKNLKSAMNKIASIMDKEKNIVADEKEIVEVNSYILSCFQKYNGLENLRALVGSQLTIEELLDIEPEYYSYLLNVIKDEFDVIIIDSNSSLNHVTTAPLLNMSSIIYYILNLDFNNVRNNARYKGTLKDIGLYEKVRYILNEDVESSDKSGEERLEFTSKNVVDMGFALEAKIPLIDKNTFLNRVLNAKPVVFDQNIDYTALARLEISKIADQIWEIGNLESLKNEYERVSNKAKKKGLFR